MLTLIMKWISSAALLLAGVGFFTANYQAILEFVICVSGLLVLSQAVRAGKYFWAAGFLAIAMLFNPVVPIVLSRKTFLWLDWVCLMTFMISLAVLKREVTLTVPSITSSKRVGIESL